MIIVDVFVPGAAKTKGSMEVRNRATVAGNSSDKAAKGPMPGSTPISVPISDPTKT